MAGTRRATAGISWRLGFAGEPPQSKASAPVCQDGRIGASASGGSPNFRIDLGFRRSLSFSSAVLPAGALTFASTGAIAVTTSAIIVAGIAIVVLAVIVSARGRANKRLAGKNDQLGAALRQSQQKTKELEAALQQAERKITGLEKQISSLSAELASKGEEPSDKRARFVALPADGREAFSPVLDRERVYKIIIEGTCGLLEQGFFGTKHPAGRADGFYRTDDRGAFSDCHEWLHVDDEPLSELLRKGTAKICQEDRETHRYSFRMKGAGQKVGISLRPYWREKIIGAAPSNLTLAVEMLPEGTSSPGSRRREKTPEENAGLKSKLESLRCRAHRESHLLDAEFQQQYARHNSRIILSDLKEDWAREYDQFMHNAELKQLAQKQAPQVFDWLEARVKIVQLAERLMVTPPSLPPRKKMTADEVRARIIRRQGVRVDDGIALTKLKAEKIAEAKAMLDSLGLDPEERERLETELIQDILEAGEDENNAKGGTTL